jgi:asparagine synthetase B (glutamine-hydrolysing)
MCGFSIVFSKKEKIHNNLIKIAEKELGPRGPSYSRHYISQDVYMYQSVLSIQSNPDRDSKIFNISKNFNIILYNGEIYDEHNYESDTELINNSSNLAATLEDVDGMFAVAKVEIYRSSFNIDVYRDISGEKRIFYYNSPRLFVVASTPSFIIKVMNEYDEPIRVNETALKDYYVTRHYISNQTSILGIEQLPPGHKLNYNTHLSVKKLWSPRKYLNESLIKQLNQFSYYDYKNHLRNTLTKTINKMQKKVLPHVDIYSIVSGGVDSSIVTYLLEESRTTIKKSITLTFGEKDFVANQAYNLFKKLKSEQLIKNINESEYYNSYLECLKLCCSPIPAHDFASANILYKVLKPGSIIYGGEAADELFLGYNYYQNCIKSEYAMSVRNTYKLSFGEEIQEDYDYAFDFFLSCGYDTKDAHIKSCSFVDYFHSVPNSTFQSTDLIGSNNGIECRTPFSRKDIIILALNSPVHLIQGKKPLNDIFKDCFGIYPFKKQGFSGFPNEMRIYLKTDFEKSKSLFGSYNENKLIEWKYINTEFFLDTFKF